MDFVTKVLTVLFGYITLFYGVRGFHNDPKCGENQYRNPKIIGGENVKEAEFPWFISIKETGRYVCGGFIINQKAVISAAHCFKNFAERVAKSPKTISVTLAGHYLNHKKAKKHLSKLSKWEIDVKVKRIIRHPKYNVSSNSGKYDIALLLLEENIQSWNHGVRPVCLPTEHINIARSVFSDSRENISSLMDFQTGEVAIVAGWPSDTRSMLQKVRLTLYNNEECSRILRERNVTIKTDIDSTMLCAGSTDMGIDSCSGDSGSALMIRRGKVWVAIGIVSSGFGPCGIGIPGLYTRIASYMEWIDFHNEQTDSSILLKKPAAIVSVNKKK